MNVPAELDGLRLDRIVAQVAGLSRSMAKALTSAGSVLVNGEVGQPADTVPAGSGIEVRLPEQAPGLQAEKVPFEVRFEDDYVAVVDKPAGLVTHPGGGVTTPTLAAGLLERWPQIEGVGDAGRWGLVHRLDRDTSGLLLVGLTTAAFEALRAQMKERMISRQYRALARGHFEVPTGTIEAPVGADPDMPTRRRVDARGKPARTHYRVTAAWEEPPLTMLAVTLDTGRTHQIRVHMASIGHPLVGDTIYGRGGPPLLGRLWLHSLRLSFRHPSTGEPVDVSSPLPDELQKSLSALGDPFQGLRNGW